MPRATSTGHFEEQPALDVYPLGIPRDDMEDEDQQPLEGQLAFATEVFRVLFWVGVNAAGKESKNTLKKSAGLARKFQARPVP